MKKKLIMSASAAALVSCSISWATVYDLTGLPYGTTDQQAAGVTPALAPVDCGPTSTANSLAMLQNNPANPIPGLLQPAGGGNSAIVNTINALSTAMGTTAPNPPVTNGGTTDANMITGKINYINNQGLSDSVRVEYQSASSQTINRNTNGAMGTGNTIPTLAFLAAQMAAGQDVEMGFNWLDGSGNPNGGHWFTVDYLDYDPANPGATVIGFLDPWNNTPGGGAEQISTRLVSTYTLAAPYGPDPAGTYIQINYNGGGAGAGDDPTENPDGDTNAFVDVIVSESPIPEPATLGVLGFGALALLGRRRQA